MVLLYTVTSCSVQNHLNKDDFKRMPEGFSAKFYDKLDTLHYNYDNRVYTRSLLKDFSGLDNINYAQPVVITVKGDALFLDFVDTFQKKHVLKFYGKRYKSKFVFYTSYETVSFPVLFIQKDMTRFTVYLPDAHEILFEKHDVSEGMFLLFGAGNSSKSDYKFKLLTHE
ncbi:hypothetical protein HYN49_01290 [Flavobacterium pallidum]|uniref:Uncharacterized protein n=2 Tax=Flavobacterium pallidum TaxID=2172098 RepID=A0A2S1SE33_9FLAO|nr:hypothetical protein HYN49_01290 [Flavobacterium pallidum]